jgi:hypothetical protein
MIGDRFWHDVPRYLQRYLIIAGGKTGICTGKSVTSGRRSFGTYWALGGVCFYLFDEIVEHQTDELGRIYLSRTTNQYRLRVISSITQLRLTCFRDLILPFLRRFAKTLRTTIFHLGVCDLGDCGCRSSSSSLPYISTTALMSSDDTHSFLGTCS